VLSCFAESRTTAKKGYLDHVRQGIEMGKRPDLVGGGLIRSLGGWAEAKGLQKEDIRLKGDERIFEKMRTSEKVVASKGITQHN